MANKERNPPAEDEMDDDDALISSFLSNQGMDAAGGTFDFGDTVGKVDDAVDYEDISDDDLPSEEDASSKPAGGDVDVNMGDDLLGELAQEGEEAGGEVDFSELFGDMEDQNILSDPVASRADGELGDLTSDMDLGFGGSNDALPSSSGAGSADDLFRYGMQDVAMGCVTAVQDPVELAKQYYPDFTPHSVLSFSTLFKAKPGTLQTCPQKVPKVCVPTKVNIEMAPDEANLFNKATSATHKGTVASRSRGVVFIASPVEEVSDDDEEMGDVKDMRDEIFDRDLEIACDDWDSKLEAAMLTPPPSPPRELHDSEDVIEFGRPVKVCLPASDCDSLY